MSDGVLALRSGDAELGRSCRRRIAGAAVSIYPPSSNTGAKPRHSELFGKPWCGRAAHWEIFPVVWENLPLDSKAGSEFCRLYWETVRWPEMCFAAAQ